MYGAEVMKVNDAILLKWRLESYSPIKEYKVNRLFAMSVKNNIIVYRIFKIYKVRGRYKIQFFYLQLQWRRKGDEKWNLEDPEVTDYDKKGNQFTVKYVIKGIQPGSYEANLLARNIFGWSAPSELHTFTGGTNICIHIYIF